MLLRKGIFQEFGTLLFLIKYDMAYRPLTGKHFRVFATESGKDLLPSKQILHA